MICLSVNVNKIATLRNSRGGALPSVAAFAEAAIETGAHGITVHPRPDERHIRRDDVTQLAELCRGRVEFNVEGYPDARYLELVAEVQPTQATLVPDPPGALTSNAGWNTHQHAEFLRGVVAKLHESAERVALFVEPELDMIDRVAATGAERIELYTGPFAEAFAAGSGEAAFRPYVRAAERALAIGVAVNAGHDLDLENLRLMRTLPGLLEVSIGHALVHDALWMGWRPAVAAYLEALKSSPER